MTRKRAVSADGTELAYYVIGKGSRVWLMPPAMGAPLVSMKHILERFQDDYTFVSWDQRGFYGSGIPRDPDAMKVADHVRDMEAVIAAEGLDRFVLGGWSMAVQLSLELYHQRPDAVRALVLINGPYERALSNITPLPGAEAMAMAVLGLGTRAGALLNPLSRAILGARGAGRLLHKVGFLAGDDPDFFEEVLAEFCTVDWPRYFTMTRHLHAHSAADYLAGIRVPTLITTGTRDILTPPHTAEKMHRMIRGSELFVIPRATHYVVAEYPRQLTDRIAAFLGRLEARVEAVSEIG